MKNKPTKIMKSIKCPKCGHVAGFVSRKDNTGYCMYCCRTTPINELKGGNNHEK